jgi:hypothetical protein
MARFLKSDGEGQPLPPRKPVASDTGCSPGGESSSLALSS